MGLLLKQWVAELFLSWPYIGIAVLFCVGTTAIAYFLHFLYAIALLKMNVVDYP